MRPRRLDPARRPGQGRLSVVFWWDFVRGVLVVLFKLLYRTKLVGQWHVPPSGPVIIASNHQSHFDPVLIGMLVHDRPPTILARRSLFRFPPFAWLIRTLGATPLDRDRGDRAAIQLALDELAAGRCVFLFPEGSRTRDGTVGPFKNGVSLLARRSGAPILPIAVEGAHDIWPKGRAGPRLRGRIAVIAGTPVPAERFREDPGGALERLRDEIDRLRRIAHEENRRRGGKRRA